MRLLFVHQNFPGQYRHLAPAMAVAGHEVVALGMTAEAGLPGVRQLRYRPSRGSTTGVHPWAADFETKVIRAEACAAAAARLRDEGFVPDLVCVHPGWGEALLLREVWPAARQLHYVEFFYGPEGRDIGFDPEFGQPDLAARCRLRLKNVNPVLNLVDMDWGLSPTRWQADTVPAAWRDRLSVVHDGIDTDALVPDDAAVFEATDDQGQALRLTRADRVVTFVNRQLEPLRGFHVFMRALPELLARDPQARVLLIGGDGVAYGSPPAGGGGWKDALLRELDGRLDRSRVHFLGPLPYARYLSALRISRAHVYLSYPFVLSWSLIEAMSLGAPLIASDTAPVREVIDDGVEGRLVDFFDREALVDAITQALAQPDDWRARRQAARARAQRDFDLHRVCLPAQRRLLEQLARGETPSRA